MAVSLNDYLVSADESDNDNGVLVLDEYTFEQAVADNEYLLVEFYAPWW